MTDEMIQNAIMEAYSNLEEGPIQSMMGNGIEQVRQFIKGSWNNGSIEMWFNHNKSLIETAWPKPAINLSHIKIKNKAKTEGLKIIIENNLFVNESKDDVSIIDAIFYIQYNGVCFPYQEWTDFAYPQLVAWEQALVEIINLDNIVCS